MTSLTITTACRSAFRLVVVGGMLFCVFSSATAQNRQELEEKRKRILREISVTNNLLEKTSRDKAAALDRYTTLQKQIERRERLIQTLTAEIAAAQSAITRNTAVVASLEQDIQIMRADYARTIRQAYRRKSLTNPLLFILSADNLNQAFRRWLFLLKYDRFRKTQADAIVQTQQALQIRTATLESTRLQQTELLQSLQQQRQMLEAELQEKERLLRTLKADEERLRTDLKKQQAQHEALNAAIERIIQEEVRKQAARREEVMASAPPATVESAPATAEDVPAPAAKEDAATTSFRQNRGRLPWPVQNGYVSRRFGRQKHPTLANIEIDNKGIDIRTDERAPVKAVCDGIVSGIQYVPGHENTIILQHGDFYTVYSNLSEVSLSKGARVKAGQVMGRVYTNPISNAAELHFEVWYQTQRLNPSRWLKVQ
ncbi:MAG: peptidoglycan DD-metalloendopeptidase family protein [Saprospiraceae bacterium]|nr:peptidoglycan DD-metalloendopeptidase family protein [Saprospiraceae bacterium]MDW8230286.1 peptidoglycan DD-metalloendopeptidase family protein [Saprospiraceae bacterium]